MGVQLDTYGLEARFWLVSYLPTIRPVIPIRVRVLRQHRSKRALNSVPLQNSREWANLPNGLLDGRCYGLPQSVVRAPCGPKKCHVSSRSPQPY